MRPLRYVILFLALILAVGGFVMANGTQEKTGTPAATATQPVAGSSGKYKEAPMLDALVAQGKLPPVAQRLPENPKVEPMIDQIGKYGGTITVYATGNSIWDDFQGMWGAALYRIPQSGVGIEPDLAAGYSINKAKTEFTIKLRKGLKWSDGHPFTSADIAFMYNDMINNHPHITTWNSLPQVTKVLTPDPLTAILVAPGGLGTLPLEIAGWQGGRSQSFQPSFYLKKWDIHFNPDANKLAKQEGFDNWYDCLYWHYWWSPQTDLNLPLVTPWLLTSANTTLEVYKRNPYFWRVDPNGDQLPYLDGFVVSIVNSQTYQLKVSGGEAAIAYTHTTLNNLSLYKTSAQAGNYTVTMFPGVYSSDYTLQVAQNYKEPAVRAILNNVKFRQALSVAINRQDINNTLLDGLGTPSQVCPLKSASFYQKGWCSYYAQFDPALANKLLDEVGLNKKNSAGYRLLPNGKVFQLLIEYDVARNTSFAELLQQYFQAVGINTFIKLEDSGLLTQRLTAGDIMIHLTDAPNPPSDERDAYMSVWIWETGFNPNWAGAWEREKAAAIFKMTGKDVLPPNWSFMKTPYDKTIPGEATIPDSWRQYYLDVYRWRVDTPGTQQYIDDAHKVFNFWIHNLYDIGTVGQAPTPLIASNKLGNVMKPGWVKGVPLAAQLVQEWQDQVYLK